jgi:HEAT repeat protein
MKGKGAYFLTTALSLVWAAASGIPQEVVRPPQPGGTLSARMDWAFGEASRRSFRDGSWVGYSIRRLMGEHSSIGSFDCRATATPTLQEIISGQRNEYSPSKAAAGVEERARQVLDDMDKEGRPEKKVWKDVAILVRYGRAAKTGIERVEMSNLDLRFDLKRIPLIWLGEAEDAESLAWLKKAYRTVNEEEVKENILAAVGIHQNSALAIPILASVLESREPEHLRRMATFWLSQQNDKKTYELLLETARKDRSREVREGAVFGISLMELEESVDALIGLAKSADDEEVRRQAIFWLGQKASIKATETLKRMAYEGGDQKIQEQAIFALSQLSGKQGVDELIKLAKTHPNPELRKKAIFWLGASGDPRALEVLVEIIKGK